MPYYIVTTVLAYYILPLTSLTTYSTNAHAHMQSYEADKFSAEHTSKEGMLEIACELHKHKGGVSPTYIGIGDPFVEYCTLDHPSLSNRMRAIEKVK